MKSTSSSFSYTLFVLAFFRFCMQEGNGIRGRDSDYNQYRLFLEVFFQVYA